MTDDPPNAESSRRIERLIEVLSLLSLGEYEPAMAHLEVGGAEDRLSVLEQGLSMFVHELADARRENLAYVTQLEDNKRDVEHKLETIERQQLAIRELSTPILRLWKDILTLPIIGIVDTHRAMEMTERLLEEIASSGARCVIIDVTGVDVIDTMTANHFMQMIRAASLLGAHCVVTGLSPDTAQTIVSIGVELGSIRTMRSLEDGLQHCLQHLRGRGPRAATPERTQWTS